MADKRDSTSILDQFVAWLAKGSKQGIDDMNAAFSGYRVPNGAVLTDAGYVMPQNVAQGNYDSALQREPDTFRALTLLGGAMTPARGAGIAARAGTEAKTAVAASHALPMDEASRMARAREMGFDPERVVYHGTDADFREFDLGLAANPKEKAVFFTNKASEAEHFGDPREYLIKGDMLGVRWKDFSEDPIYDPEIMAAILDHAKSVGSSVVNIKGIQNFEGGPLSTTVAVFDPKNIRSRFAAFDPAKADSAELLASRASAPPGLLTIEKDEPKR